jgi:hypothetical protein
MTRYRVMTWRGIPAQVKAIDDAGTTSSVPLPPFFQQEIDRVAMRAGIIEDDEYLDAWTWSDELERDGSAQEVADQVAQELADEWRRANGSADS